MLEKMGSAEASNFRSRAYGGVHTSVASVAHHTPLGHRVGAQNTELMTPLP